MAHAITKTYKSQDLQLAQWKLRRADGVDPFPKPTGLRPRKNQRFSLNLKAGKNPCPSSKAVKQQEFPLTQTFCSIQVLITHIRKNSLLSLWIQMLISSRNSLTDTPRMVFDQIFGYPVAQSS